MCVFQGRPAADELFGVETESHGHFPQRLRGDLAGSPLRASLDTTTHLLPPGNSPSRVGMFVSHSDGRLREE